MGEVTQKGVELSWQNDVGAQQYRVEILAAGESDVLERIVVTESRLVLGNGPRMPAGLLWQVYSSDDASYVQSDPGGWKLHVPPVALPRPPGTAATVIDWKRSGATAYRLIIRDDAAAEVVLRQPVIGPPAHVAWETLLVSHPHRVRIQEWRGGEWSDLHPYRPLVPPAELALRIAPPDPDAPGVRHVVLVALSGRPAGSPYGERRPPQWWEQRLRLMHQWTVPSVRAILRSGDRWVIRCDSAVPADCIDALRGAHPDAIVSRSTADAVRALAQLEAGCEVLAVTRITAGDRVHSALGGRVVDHASALGGGDGARRLVSFPLAARLDRERSTAQLETYFAAPVHTVILRAPGVLEEAFDDARAFIDRAYRSTRDAGIAAILRAWPGPNALSALHGSESVSIDPDGLRALFELDGAEPLAGQLEAVRSGA